MYLLCTRAIQPELLCRSKVSIIIIEADGDLVAIMLLNFHRG